MTPSVIVIIAFLVLMALSRGYLEYRRWRRSDLSNLSNRIAFMCDEAVGIAKNTYRIKLNYKIESLQNVDKILELLHMQFTKKPNPEVVAKLATVFGAYVGECIRRRFHGSHWKADHPERGPLSYPLHWPNGECFPMSWCLKRIENGPSESVWANFIATNAKRAEAISTVSK